MNRPVAVLLVCTLACLAHEGHKNLKPTKAEPDLKRARHALAAAKRKLTAQGRYACCTKPACSLCARTTGSCNCGANVAAGLGACGECYGAWKGKVKLLPAEHQACPKPAAADPSIDAALRESSECLLRAKKTLVAEKRFACCIRGGCGQCAHEAGCPCGGDLASKKRGVCGDCLDGWHSGQGAFEGIDPAEVTLSAPEADMDGMRAVSGWYTSGTSQAPAASPMEMLSTLLGGWTVMGSGELFATYATANGERGHEKLFSTNWAMLMASHRAGPGTLTVRAMLSAEPATITAKRYPLLFAGGETANGVPIINGQHPHDLFMELAASYKIRLGERTSVQLYGGPRGEPALGPTAYPHRASSSENPVAVISHHLQDSTHIATNVATLGATHGPVTLEASGFHGREPDEKRWGIEGGSIDSFAARVTVTPWANWSGQFSMGRIASRESTHPLRPSLRSTASLMYVRGNWATTLIWGRNNDLEYTQLPNLPAAPLSRIRPLHVVSVPTRIPRQVYNSYLAETTLKLKRNWIWGRAESADRDSTFLFQEAPFVLLVDENRLARVQAYTAGYERELPWQVRYVNAGLGGQVASYRVPPLLGAIYGEHPVGAQLFLRLRLVGSAPH